MDNILNYGIEKIDIFNSLCKETKYKLLTKGRVKKIAKKEALFHEKDIVNKVYFLINGKVSIFKMNENGERKIIFILREGEMINEIILEANKNSAVGCECFDKALVVEYDLDDFIEIMKSDFNLAQNIFIHMEKRTRRLYRQLKNSISIKMDKKLASKLYRISREFGISEGEWTYLNVNLSITYIADMLGCKRETLSRSMKVLQDHNLVKIEDKKLYIKQEELANYFKRN